GRRRPGARRDRRLADPGPPCDERRTPSRHRSGACAHDSDRARRIRSAPSGRPLAGGDLGGAVTQRQRREAGDLSRGAEAPRRARSAGRTRMNPITDDELVLYRYRDGLDGTRIAQITAELAASQALRERYAAIERAIAHFGRDDVTPDPDLGARLWRRLEPQLEAAGVIASQRSLLDRLREWLA